MGIDGVEFSGPAWKSKRDGRDVKVGTGLLEWGRCVVRRENAGRKRGEGQGLLNDYALVRWSDEFLRGTLCFRGWSRSLREFPLLTWGFGLVWFVAGIPIVRKIALFPLSSGFGLVLDPLDQWQYIIGRLVNVLPIEFIGVGSRSSIAASPADEDLAMVF